MGNDGKPKPLKIKEAGDCPPPSASRPKPLSIPDAQPVASGVSPAPRALSIPDAAPVPPPQTRAPRPLSIPDAPPPPVRAEPPRSIVDDLVEKAQAIEPSVQKHRIKGRIDTVLESKVTDLLDFGARNLAPLQDTSNEKAKIASEIARIDAIGWIERTKDASCKAPSLLDRLRGGGQSPDYFDGMLKKARAELLAFATRLEDMKRDFLREVTDLHLDAIALIVCKEVLKDTHAQHTADNRGRTLLMAHQQAAMLQQTIETSLVLCADHIGQIDHLLSVTLPAWKVAFAAR
jgi:hypothetical protein